MELTLADINDCNQATFSHYDTRLTRLATGLGVNAKERFYTTTYSWLVTAPQITTVIPEANQPAHMILIPASVANAPKTFESESLYLTAEEAAMLAKYGQNIDVVPNRATVPMKGSVAIVFVFLVDLFQKESEQWHDALANPALLVVSLAIVYPILYKLLNNQLVGRFIGSPKIDLSLSTLMTGGAEIGLLLIASLMCLKPANNIIPMDDKSLRRTLGNVAVKGAIGGLALAAAGNIMALVSKGTLSLRSISSNFQNWLASFLTPGVVFPVLLSINTLIADAFDQPYSTAADIKTRAGKANAAFTIVGLPILYILIEALLKKLFFVITRCFADSGSAGGYEPLP